MKACLIAAAVLLLFCASIQAQEPKVRASMVSQETIYVGQRTTMVVELLVPGYFSGAAAFHMPDPSGLILIPPTGSPTVSSETVDGASFTVQRHEVAVLAAHAGAFTIPPVAVRIQFKRNPLDKDVVAAILTTPDVRFTVTQPPGTEKLGHVISAKNLQVTEEWKPEPGKTRAKAGDAFTRTIRFTAPDVPGMMFPPFPAGHIDGIGIYLKKPAVFDKSDRGSLTGERRDVITYSCKRAGEFIIPAARLTWWDLESKQLRTVDFPEQKLDVASNPALESQAAVPAKQKSAKGTRIALIAAISLLLGMLARSARARRIIVDFISPLRPKHLQPLNPTPQPEPD